MSKRSKLARAYDFFVARWILSALILTAGAYWFIFLQFLGQTLKLMNATNQLTPWGHVITWPLFAGSLVFAIAKSLGDNWNNVAQSKAQTVMGTLLDCVNAVTTDKLIRFDEYIASHQKGEKLTTFADITEPRKQVISNLNNMQSALSKLFDIPPDKIGLSVIYRPGSDQPWEWLYARNTDDDLTLEEVTENPQSTFNQLLRSDDDTLFYPNKKIGMADQKYVQGRKDARHANEGSVLCRNIGFGKDGSRFQAVLSITTYGERLCDPEDHGSQHKINNVILDAFVTRLRLELGLLYMKEQLNPACLNCPAHQRGHTSEGSSEVSEGSRLEKRILNNTSEGSRLENRILNNINLD